MRAGRRWRRLVTRCLAVKPLRPMLAFRDRGDCLEVRLKRLYAPIRRSSPVGDGRPLQRGIFKGHAWSPPCTGGCT